MRPALITMEGERCEIAETLGMDRADVRYIKRNLSPDEILYLNSRYPEYMGAIPAIIAKIASAAVGVGKSIAGAVKKKREQKKALSEQRKAEEEAKIAQYQYQQQILLAQQAKKKQQNNMLLMIGIPAALALFMLSRR
jgi:hypothetical protein